MLLKNAQNEVELLYLGDENIYMFSICLPKYSFLTSKSFSSKLIEVILLGGFSTFDPNRQSEVEELNELGKIILQYATLNLYHSILIDVATRDNPKALEKVQSICLKKQRKKRFFGMGYIMQ